MQEEEINAKKLRLIQLVKEYPVLYDLAHPDHKNSEVKKVPNSRRTSRSKYLFA